MPVNRNWAPNQEPLVLVKCGDIVTAWPVLHTLGERYSETICDIHGWQRIKRKATPDDFKRSEKHAAPDRLF